MSADAAQVPADGLTSADRPSDLPHLLRPPRPSSAEGTLQVITWSHCMLSNGQDGDSNGICKHFQRQASDGPASQAHTVQSQRQSQSIRNWAESRWPSTCSSPPSPTPSSLPSSLPSTRVSQEFNSWYHRLRIHSVYDFETETPLKSRSSLTDWVRHQPLTVLQLDPVDRVVLKIAGNIMQCLSPRSPSHESGRPKSGRDHLILPSCAWMWSGVAGRQVWDRQRDNEWMEGESGGVSGGCRLRCSLLLQADDYRKQCEQSSRTAADIIWSSVLSSSRIEWPDTAFLLFCLCAKD